MAFAGIPVTEERALTHTQLQLWLLGGGEGGGSRKALSRQQVTRWGE